MAKVTLYVKDWCPYCQRAKQLLASKGVTDIELIDIEADPEQAAQMMTRTGRRTVPQIYVGETHVGGFDDMAALDRAGRLDPLLAG
ncbi:glutaredoxin 3 [Comamonas serinivorans]|uniref:Glutaredoxin n=1 Tax=Comamonas serinivorans TaxID=1082851 RepID=A0A1Y0EQU0_9BURK|nr:glutaredoxin 3 [Comamonas serinivorans]ARU05868.1 glutaredoxin 3 [Comamonas serinivorans]